MSCDVFKIGLAISRLEGSGHWRDLARRSLRTLACVCTFASRAFVLEYRKKASVCQPVCNT